LQWLGTNIIELDGKKIKLRIWSVGIRDTPGQERFQTLTRTCYRGSMGFMVMYDITQHQSFQNLSLYMEYIQEHADPGFVRMLIGTNCHRENSRVVQREAALQFATVHRIRFMEVSAEKDINIDEAFYTLTRDILAELLQRQQLEQPQLSAGPKIQDTQQPKQSKGFFSSVRKFLGRLGMKSEQTNSQPLPPLPLLPPPSPPPPPPLLWGSDEFNLVTQDATDKGTS